MPIQTLYKPDFPVQYRIATYTLNPGDNGTEIQFNASAAITANLPPVAEAQNGYNVLLRNIGSGSLTIDPSGGELIDGASTATLETDQWRWIRSDGTGWKTLSRWVPNGGAGKVLQVLNVVKSDTFTTTSTSFVTITGLSQEITLADATSKVLVMATVSGSHEGTAPVNGFIKLRRGTTGLWLGDTAGSRTSATGGVLGALTSGDSEGIGRVPFSTFSFTGLDAPGTTGPHTYDVQIMAGFAGASAYVNRGIEDADSATRGRSSSSITLMEVGA